MDEPQAPLTEEQIANVVKWPLRVCDSREDLAEAVARATWKMARAALSTAPVLLQDEAEGRALSKALASKPDARVHAREAAAAISTARYIADMEDTLDKVASALGVDGRDADKLISAALASAPHPPSNTLGDALAGPGDPVASLPTPPIAAGSGWVRMEDAAPPADTDCVVWVRYSPGPGHFAIDRWEMQREDPIGMGGPTIETGYGWNDNFESDVIYWLALAPVPDADYDSRDLPTSEASRDL